MRGDEVYFSTVRPRPVDNAFLTLRTQRLSEFDLHARAILGFTVDTIMISPGAAEIGYAGGETSSTRRIRHRHGARRGARGGRERCAAVRPARRDRWQAPVGAAIATAPDVVWWPGTVRSAPRCRCVGSGTRERRTRRSGPADRDTLPAGPGHHRGCRSPGSLGQPQLTVTAIPNRSDGPWSPRTTRCSGRTTRPSWRAPAPRSTAPRARCSPGNAIQRRSAASATSTAASNVKVDGDTATATVSLSLRREQGDRGDRGHVLRTRGRQLEGVLGWTGLAVTVLGVSSSESPGYAGDITPEQAWELLSANPEAVLVDCRTGGRMAFLWASPT